MKQNKFIMERAFHLATACAVLALILFVPATMSQTKRVSILFYVLSALLLIAGGVILYLAHQHKRNQINYFLYDSKTNTSVPVTALSAERVRNGVDRYLEEHTEELLSLWSEIPKELRMRLEKERSYRPLVSYRLFLELSEQEDADIQIIFTGADDRAVGYLCRAIRDGGDGDTADYIFELKKNAEHDHTRIGNFFRKNHRCFEDRLLTYTKRHINDFYMEK